MWVRNQAVTKQRNWPLGRMAPGPWDSFFAAATLGGDRNLARTERVQPLEESLHFKPLSVKVLKLPLGNSESFVRELTAIKIKVQGDTPPWKHYFCRISSRTKENEC